MPKRLVRVAIYGRVSTGEQNPDAQLVELRAYAERRGFAIHREYVDHVTGDATARRRRAPAFEALMADARRRRFDCVLVWKYDRFACIFSQNSAGRDHGNRAAVIMQTGRPFS